MNSMTGYAFKETVESDIQFSVEIKSVNNRFLDLNIYMPSFMNPVESKIRNIVSEKVSRGKVEVFVRIKELGSKSTVTVDKNAALMYYNAFSELNGILGKNEEIPLSLIVQQEGVMNVCHNYDAEFYWNLVEPVFNEVFEMFLADRKREGENLKKDLLEKLSALKKCAHFFVSWQPKMEEKFREQITCRFNEILGDKADENRIMAEVAAMVVKYTVNEEIIRLNSHLDALEKELTENPLPGKRLDFICQEANREINTIGSKNQFAEVGAMVVNAKDALENIREQAKNVE